MVVMVPGQVIMAVARVLTEAAPDQVITAEVVMVQDLPALILVQIIQVIKADQVLITILRPAILQMTLIKMIPVKMALLKTTLIQKMTKT